MNDAWIYRVDLRFVCFIVLVKVNLRSNKIHITVGSLETERTTCFTSRRFLLLMKELYDLFI